MKIAVTGAFSYSGKYITGRLLERGEQIIALTGHPNRPDPFNGQVKAYPLDFDEANMTKSLQGVDVLVNTYWVRFDKGENTQPRAVENTRILVNAANAAGVKRVVHISIANPSADSHLPYYWGKAANEKAVTESGMEYAILRPTVDTPWQDPRLQSAGPVDWAEGAHSAFSRTTDDYGPPAMVDSRRFISRQSESRICRRGDARESSAWGRVELSTRLGYFAAAAHSLRTVDMTVPVDERTQVRNQQYVYDDPVYGRNHAPRQRAYGQ